MICELCLSCVFRTSLSSDLMLWVYIRRPFHFLIKNYWANLCQTWFVAPIDFRYWDRVQSCLIAYIKVFQLEIYFFFTMTFKQPSLINPVCLVPKEIVRINEASGLLNVVLLSMDIIWYFSHTFVVYFNQLIRNK